MMSPSSSVAAGLLAALAVLASWAYLQWRSHRPAQNIHPHPFDP
jgi:hypothetical protein